MTTYVLTAIGVDRPGLVSALAAVVDEHHGSWVDSQMSLLAGMFAGIVEVELPPQSVPGLLESLPRLEGEVGLTVTATPSQEQHLGEDAPVLHLHLLGQDRRGMVREVSSALASTGATVDGLRSWTREAPEGGGLLFEAEVEARLTARAEIAAVREALERIAAELMVDIEVDTLV